MVLYMHARDIDNIDLWHILCLWDSMIVISLGKHVAGNIIQKGTCA